MKFLNINKNVSFYSLKNCSNLFYCKKFNENINSIYFINFFLSKNYKKSLTNEYSIPVKLHNNFQLKPILIEYNSIQFLLYFFKNECKNYSRFLNDKDVLNNVKNYWYLPFSDGKNLVVECNYSRKSDNFCQYIEKEYKKDKHYVIDLKACKKNIYKNFDQFKFISNFSGKFFFY